MIRILGIVMTRGCIRALNHVAALRHTDVVVHGVWLPLRHRIYGIADGQRPAPLHGASLSYVQQ